ncbi:MAG: glycyl radical protein [Lachnospiraceae bacterium]|nr:glycyl radical protein [Lachnospiraceae bacterium]
MSKEIRGSERIIKLYNRLNEQENYVDIQRARYFTESFKETEGEAINVRFARALLHTAKNLELYIEEDQLFAGQIGGPERYGILYPELDACFFTDLESVLSDRAEATFGLKEEDRRYLAEEVAPFWKGKTYYEDFSASLPGDLLRLTYDPKDTKKSRFLINETQSMNSATQWVHDYSIGLNRGFESIRKEALQNLKELDIADFEDEEDYRLTREYLESAAIVSEAVITLAGRYAKEAKRLAGEVEDEKRRGELLKLSEILNKVPAYPAESFYEALQSQFIMQMFSRLEQKTSGTISNGRMDQYLYPFYKKDREAGILTDEQVDEYLSALWLSMAKFRDVYVSPAGGAFSDGYAHWEAVTIGGQTAEGFDATNELTYLFLENKRNLPLDFPDLAVRIHSGTPERLLHEIAKTIKVGSGHPKLLNDEEIIPVNVSKGATFAQANDYAVSGCTETRMPAVETWTSKGPSINLAAVVELTLRNGRVEKYGDELLSYESGSPESLTDWDKFYEAFIGQLSFYIKKTCDQIRLMHHVRKGHFASPFGSVLHSLCQEQKRDLHSQWIKGGLDFAFFDMVGYASTVDSLAAVKKVIFEEKRATLSELVKALDADFEGYEVLRQRLLHAPKYGNNDAYADDLARNIDRIAGEISAAEAKKEHENFVIDIRYVPASANVVMGKVIGALPDGRKRSLPLSDGTSAAQGADVKGPTAVLLSNFNSKNRGSNNRAARLLNLKFTTAAVAGKEGEQRLVDLIKSWRDLKLWHIQFNVIDQKTLLDAKQHPEKYRSLIVRVAGYSAYFVNLSDELQNDIISRTSNEQVA